MRISLDTWTKIFCSQWLFDAWNTWIFVNAICPCGGWNAEEYTISLPWENQFYTVWLNLCRVHSPIHLRIRPDASVSSHFINKHQWASSSDSHMCPRHNTASSRPEWSPAPLHFRSCPFPNDDSSGAGTGTCWKRLFTYLNSGWLISFRSTNNFSFIPRRA